jgi:hypothetical protein
MQASQLDTYMTASEQEAYESLRVRVEAEIVKARETLIAGHSLLICTGRNVPPAVVRALRAELDSAGWHVGTEEHVGRTTLVIKKITAKSAISDIVKWIFGK